MSLAQTFAEKVFQHHRLKLGTEFAFKYVKQSSAAAQGARRLQGRREGRDYEAVRPNYYGRFEPKGMARTPCDHAVAEDDARVLASGQCSDVPGPYADNALSADYRPVRF